MKKSGTLKTPAGRKLLLSSLLKEPVTNVRFSKNRVCLDFFGHRISDLVLVQTEDHVAEWSRRRKQVFIDRGISGPDRKISFRALCVHEVVEKFLAEKYGLNVDKEAHKVACVKEKEYLKKHGGNWRSHELIIYWVWKKLGGK